MGEGTSVSSVVDGLAARSDTEIGILRAAYHVMGRRGSNRLTLQSIADEAGVSKGLILYHFDNKNAVLQHAMEWALLRTESHIRRALEAAEGTELLVEVLEVIFVEPGANREFQLVYLDLIEAAAREESFADLPDIVRGIVEGLYAEVIQTGVERGELDVDDPAAAAHRMRVIVDGVFLQWLQRRDWQQGHAAAKELCLDMLRRQLKAA